MENAQELAQTATDETNITAENEVAEQATIESAFYFGETLNDAQGAIDNALSIANQQGVKVAQNFSEDDSLPEGFGVAIRPVTKRGVGLQGVIIAFMPSLELIAGDDKGAEYIRSTVESSMMDKLAIAVRGRGDNAVFGGVMPKSLSDFISPARRGEGLSAFRAIASVFVAALKKKGAKKMTTALLRQVCESSAFAEAEFPQIAQDRWTNVIETMSAKAAKAGEDTAIFDHWLKTRETVEIAADELDLDGLDDLL